jgi:hypothetical protein
MGTRGFITFVVGGVEKTTYTQFDSYPEGVGISVLSVLREEILNGNPTNRLRLIERARGLRVVDESVTPSPLDIEALELWTDRYVDTLNPHQPSWYQLLRHTQGSIDDILTAGYLLDAADFPRDSLFAEWGYVIDLDDGDLEVYEGFQTEPHDVGRFASRGPVNGEPGYENRVSVYYPCKRVAAWPLDELPTNAEFVAATTGRVLAEGDDA